MLYWGISANHILKYSGNNVFAAVGKDVSSEFVSAIILIDSIHAKLSKSEDELSDESKLMPLLEKESALTLVQKCLPGL